MVQSSDVYSFYEAGLSKLLDQLGPNHPCYPEALVYQQRLAENIAQARRYGDTTDRGVQRAEIIDRLNDLAHGTLGQSFNELCDLIPMAEAVSPTHPAGTTREGFPTEGVAPKYTIHIDHATGLVIGDGTQVTQVFAEKGTPHKKEGPPEASLPSSTAGKDGTPQAELLNPFRDRGRINEAGRFFDRQRLVRELRQMLVAGNSVSLVGEPEIGKSSLLYYLYLTRAEWLPEAAIVYLDLQGVLDEADFCTEVLEALERPASDLRALRRALRTGRTVLLLDEVEKLADPSFSPRLHDLLRALAQEPALTLAVTSHRPLVEIFPPQSPTSPLHNILTEKRLPPFSPDQARAFLTHRLRGTTVSLTVGEIEQLLVSSGGHPARLQRLAEALFEARTR